MPSGWVRPQEGVRAVGVVATALSPALRAGWHFSLTGVQTRAEAQPSGEHSWAHTCPNTASSL